MLVGIKGLGAEICKNLVLSGVKSVTIVDPSPVNEQDFVSQFLVQRQDLGKNVSQIIHRTYVTIKNMLYINNDCSCITCTVINIIVIN